MAEKEEKSPSIPWLPLITLIGAGSGVLLFFPQLTSSRPEGGDRRLAGNTFDHQTINARLWQDPLGVAIADGEKNEKRNQGGNQEHSVAQFQNLLIRKCFAKSANDPLVQSAIYPLEESLRIEEQANQVQILAVMIPGGPYVEDVERRLRSRRAVIEGLGMAGYDPEKDHEIGYFYLPWQPLETNVGGCVRMLEENRIEDESLSSAVTSRIQPTRSNWRESDANGLLVPYEWCEPADFGGKNKHVAHVLVLWLIDDAFRDAPLARLADLISWLRLKFSSALQPLNISPLPVFTVLGPDNSGTLRTMVMEANDDPWNGETRQCLATTHIYSSQAAAAESRLLSEIPAAAGSRVPFERNCKNLIEQSVKQRQSDNGFCFDRTVLPDDQIAQTLWKELGSRGVTKDDHIAIISEEDTYYARALCSTFTDSKPETMLASNIHSYTYLRGIDGELPLDGKDEKETKSAAENDDKNAQSSLRPTERTEGLNQADDIRRLAKEMRRKPGGQTSLKAVGLLGSDVYDKLELLKALRPVLPEAVFFTNNLDARLAHPDEWNETHNLVVVSAFRLSLEQYENREVPPFRDSGQTALFAATLEAMHAGEAAKPLTPFIFEIGRNDPKELNIPTDERSTMTELSHYPLRIGFFIAIGILLLAWTRFVTRVPLAFSKESIEHKESIRNENPDGGNRVEAT
jgi:hypothetical protein